MARGRIMTDDEIVELVETAPEWADKPFVTTPELAERAGISRQGMHKRLVRLADEGRVQRYVAGQSAIYWTRGAAERVRAD